MITLKDKQKIILDYISNNKSQREIHRETGIARDTIRKYITEYEERLRQVGKDLSETEKVDLIDEITKQPKYKSTPRTKRVVTEDVIERIKYFLKENETKRLSGLSKQQMKKIDICEALNEEGFSISYSAVATAINKIEHKKREAYIKQEYVPGDVVEFDFGTVKLYTEDNVLREYQLAVFTSAYSNYKWARLFPKQNTACFLEAHAYFFNHIQGSFRTVVYDNTRVAVKKFLGHSEKEPTDALLKLSLYYKFGYRFCNTYSGNEKGHVERSVEVVRRKAFSKNLEFNSLAEANIHLANILDKLNSKVSFGKKLSSKELLLEEKENLLPDMPLYETSTIQDFRVNKYSTIMIDSCFYSVPDNFVDRMVRCKIYTNKIIVYDNENKICEHFKITGMHKWKIDISHYTYTLFRKPKALISSTAFTQMDSVLKNIYSTYFNNNEKEFIKVLECVGKYGLTPVFNAITHLQETCPTNISTDKIEFICTLKDDNKVLYLEDYNDDIMVNSVNMLSEFNTLL